MSLKITEEFNNHLKNFDNNKFILATKVAYYLLTSQEKKIYEHGFKQGYESAIKIYNKDKQYVPKQVKKIIGYQFSKPSGNKINDLIDKVCFKLEINKKELFSKMRTQDLVRARTLVHNILNDKFRMSLSAIGRLFDQDHTTVLYSVNMKANKERYWSPEQNLWEDYYDLMS
jgi:chromosomal replication initiation ATPase DnaA